MCYFLFERCEVIFSELLVTECKTILISMNEMATNIEILAPLPAKGLFNVWEDLKNRESGSEKITDECIH